MCLILFAWQAHPAFPLVFAGNRDEAYERASAAADFWQDDPRVYGGRDLEKGGTWLGVARTGRFAAVTNYRNARIPKGAPRSRGELTAGFLRGNDDPENYVRQAVAAGAEYGGYSLLAGNRERLFWGSNRGGHVGEVRPGVHGLSNHLLDTPWPKVRSGRQRVTSLLDADESRLIEGLFETLGDRTIAPDPDLPDTGVGLERERQLSCAFIAGEQYGTRVSTVVLISARGEVVFSERAYGPLGTPLAGAERRFSLETAPRHSVGAEF
jgi:uncharacterized protein with NRDE domain